MRLLPRVLPSIQCAKASHAQLPDISLRSATQALRLIARIPLIQRREKCPSREGKSAFTQWFPSVYARSLKDQARKSKYPRTEILEPRTQSKLICHSSTTFIPTRSNDLIQVTSQSYIAFFAILIQLHLHTHIPIMRPLCKPTSSLLVPSFLENRDLQAEKFEGESASCEEMVLRNGLMMKTEVFAEAV